MLHQSEKMFVAAVLLFLTSNCGIYSAFFNLTILHTNDVHSRFQSFDRSMKLCSISASNSNYCYGGASRRLSLIKKIRKEDPNVVLLDGGDQFQGTLWYTVLKWEPIAKLVNLARYDAMSFGNHEFDDGLSTNESKLGEIGLRPYLKAVKTTFVSSNLVSSGSEIQGMYKEYHILAVSGRKIAIIGYITPETVNISFPGPNLTFKDEVASLRATVQKISFLNINIIIAIGHSGFDVDKKICANVPGVDVVIGGHTNTFLYSGKEPVKEQKAEGLYPTIVKNVDGSKCLAVQDYAYGKYLGYLKVSFDDKGTVQNWSGNPILIDKSTPEDPEVVELLRPYKTLVSKYQKEIIGRTAVALNGNRETCRIAECNFGNIVTNAMIYSYIKRKSDSIDKGVAHTDYHSEWAPSAIALVNSAFFRDFEIDPWSNISMGDLYNTIPYANTIELIQIKGEHLKQALEHSVWDIEKNCDDPHGKFLQVAGIHVEYDMSKPNGNRVSKVIIKCSHCIIPSYRALNMSEVYNTVVNSFLKKGGDGYTMISKNLLSSDGLENLDTDMIATYIKYHFPITVGLEARIRFINGEPCSNRTK